MEDRMIYGKIFIKDLFARFQSDKCSSVAAELTVTSLLALVPLTTLVFALLALIPNFETMALQLQELIFTYFVPATGDSIQGYLVEFVGKAKRVSGIGFLMLFITALLMMRTIDKSFNHIWKIEKKQSRVRTFLVYWAVLTLGPIALGTSIVITSYINSLPLVSETVSQNSIWFKNILPFVMASLAFSVMYYVIPNGKILIKHAFSSGVVAALLFELAKSGFGVFVKYFSTYELVFGALAAIPLFLIWIYVSWNIVLFGAEVCYGLSEYKDQKIGPMMDDLSSHNLSGRVIARIKALICLIDAQNKGELISLNQEQGENTNTSSELGFDLNILYELVNEGVAVETDDSTFCLSTNPSNLTYKLILKELLNYFPSETGVSYETEDKNVQVDLERIKIQVAALLETTFIQSSEKNGIVADICC
ncbi:MAG: YihY family inner membrane protein [Kangiellaceae bacterium]